MHHRILSSAALVAGTLLSAQARGAVVIEDDFEGHATTANGWFSDGDDAADNDPGAPWTVTEPGGDIRVQVVAHPQNLNPSLPSFEAAEGDQYLHFNQSPSYTENVASVSLPSTPQTSLTLDAQTFTLSGFDGWRGGLRIVGYGSSTASPAFDVRLEDGGSNADGIVTVRGAGGAVAATGLTHNVNTWETLSINADLLTDTFSLTLDGVTVNGLTWAGGDLSAIESVAFLTTESGNRRGGIDALTISTTLVPEPTSALALLAIATVVAARRTRRIR